MFERARLRLAIYYAGALAVILLAIGISAYVILRNQLDDEINQSLAQASVDLRAAPVAILTGAAEARPRPTGSDDHSSGSDDHQPRERVPLETLSTDVFYIATSTDGTVLWNPRNVQVTQFPLVHLASQSPDDQVSHDVQGSDHRYRLISTSVQGPNQAEVRLIIGRSLSARDHQLRALTIIFGTGGLAGVLLAAAGGFWIAGRALVPIRTTLETQRRFVSDASHELRTPVAVMKANAELVLRHPDQTVEANIDQVAAINEEADHMAKLVGDLLTLARADEEQIQISRERVHLDELLDGLVRDMTALADVKGIALTAQLASGEIEADAQRIRQLGAILLDNALKFTPAGGRVTVRSWRDGHRINFAVSDTGPGISEEDHALIFDRFYRGDKARSSGGTGLGLAIAKWIVTAHNGRITVESKPNEGAAFTVRLPSGKRG